VSEKTVWTVDGHDLELSRLDKVLWPADDFTRGDLFAYLKNCGSAMLPYLRNRPVTFRSYPDGIEKAGYYRRERPKTAPDWIRGVEYVTSSDPHPITLPLIDNLAGLLWFANTGAIEFHVWSSTANDLDQPTYLLFDLDPGDDATFERVLEAAIILRDKLSTYDIVSYAKTSGRSGMHVAVPLEPGQQFETVREWSKAIAEALEEAHPDLIGVAHGATHRGELVTLDHAQNSIGRNTAAPYTARGAPGAPVSTPVTWEEIERGKIRPTDFTIATIPDRLNALPDPFSPVLDRGFRLPNLT
jgi:bifunctional non-homologous end joining protein LigD